MESENWYKLDNVAKVFLATVSKRDTRTFRVSCTLKDKIDPGILQEAVLLAIQDRPQMQVRIRRGIFWHYLEDTDITPKVVEEHERICPLLYAPAKAMLHYQVTYYGNRINLEIFHALADGTGGMEFLNIIVLHYLKLRYPGRISDLAIHSGASTADLSQDSYRQFFEKPGLKKASNTAKAYQPGGFKFSYDQLQFFEIHMPVDQILSKAKELKISLTSYLGARWMMAIRDDMPQRKRNLPITISLPVNLRNYYPSQTARNFFNSVYVTHVFDKEITPEELAAEFDNTLKNNLLEENIKTQMDSYETMEFVAPVRAVPLFIKQPIVRFFTKKSAKKVSMVFSNMGIQKPPAELNEYIEYYSGFCSTNTLFSTMFSYNGHLTLGVSSAYTNTGVVKNLVRGLSGSGVDIRVYATEVIGR
ncbi:MAG: hypothetical protein K6G45_08355 [Lachnospiraceae bacterium]|nr:hypothetical protein [Lachnospiraceae bacterium]